MQLIGFDEIKAANIQPVRFFEWVSECIEKKQETLLPPKISMQLPEHRFCNVMPCVIPFSGAMGVKVVTRFPDPEGEKPSLCGQILLYDCAHGEPLAFMDGTYITAFRTGAVAVHAMKWFANPNFYEIGWLGLGITARATFLVMAAVFPERPLKIKLLRYKDQAERFIQEFSSHKNIRFEICDDVESVVQGSDVVLSCVSYAEEDFAPPGSYKPGCTVIPVHTRGFMACDLAFDKIFADDTGHVRGFKYFSQYRNFNEVTDVVNGRAPGRESPEERILVYNIGLAIHDIYIANQIYHMLPGASPIHLSEAPEKYWL